MREPQDWTREELIRDYVGQMKAVTIPVNITIQGQQTILDLTSVESILRNAETISLQDCGCRVKWHKCNAPLDNCLSLDNEAKDSIKHGAKQVTLTQALKALKRSHKAGLVHMAYTFKGKEKPEVICSCCSCCCHSLSALVRFGIPNHVVASQYIAQQNYDTCNNCGTCTQRCQFHARKLINDKLAYNPTKCFGCGLCTSTCPTKSITLTKRNQQNRQTP